MKIPKPQKIKRRFGKKKTEETQLICSEGNIVNIGDVVIPVSSISGLDLKSSDLRTDTIADLQSSKSGISFRQNSN